MSTTAGGGGPDVLNGVSAAVAAVLGFPAVAVSVLTDDGNEIRGRFGTESAVVEAVASLCDAVVDADGPLVVSDDARLVGGPRNGSIRSWVGIPLRSSTGEVLGSIVAGDVIARDADEQALARVGALAAVTASHLERAVAERRASDWAVLFRTSPDLQCTLRRDGTVVAVNEGWEAVFGPAPREVKIDAVVAMTHPEDQPIADDAIRRVAAGEELVAFRARAAGADRVYRWFEWHVSTVSGGHASQATARDVTELVEQQRALQRSNQILTSIARLNGTIPADGPDPAWWRSVLDEVLALIGGDVGFIGSVGDDGSGPYVRPIAVADAGRAAGDGIGGQGRDEPSWPAGGTPIADAVASGRPVISNTVDDWIGDTFPGFAVPGHFVCLPVGDVTDVVGVVGVGGRSDRYDGATVDEFEPLRAFLRVVFANVEWAERNERAQRTVMAERALQKQILEGAESGIIAFDRKGMIELTNAQAHELLPRSARLPRNVLDCLIEPADIDWCRNAMREGVAAVGRIAGLGLGARLVPCEARFDPLPQGGSGGFVLRVTDISTSAALSESTAANAALQARIAQLDEQRRSDLIVVETVEMMQSAIDVDEALDLVQGSMSRLFLDARIAMFTGDVLANVLIARSGRSTDTGSPGASAAGDGFDDEIDVTECWALRTKRPHGSWPGSASVPCRHQVGGPGETRFCVPLSLAGGLQVLVVVTASSPRDAAANEAALERIGWMAQSLSGALTNVALRVDLQQAALADPLTDLPNRRAFQAEVSRLRDRAIRRSTSQAIALIDIDEFKEVNDTLGHDGGDRVLTDLAAVLGEVVRFSDVPGRLGGDEFALFLDDIDAPTALRRIDELRIAFAERTAARGRRVTVSVGVAHTDDLPGCGADPEPMLHAADAALYEAKDGGRNRVVRWTKSDG
jgi:diguanylate cyclase (GGDEF)-like protein/PAS domain S-box-containing protein